MEVCMRPIHPPSICSGAVIHTYGLDPGCFRQIRGWAHLFLADQRQQFTVTFVEQFHAFVLKGVANLVR
jgi:hypothetical protein